MPNILIVDDDHTILRLYKLILGELGYKMVNVASNGKEAVEKYKNCTQKPTLIIMDHRMPVMNGLDAMLEILLFDNNAKILFVSADTSMKDIALSKGAINFLNKPFDIHEFFKIIKQYI